MADLCEIVWWEPVPEARRSEGSPGEVTAQLRTPGAELWQAEAAKGYTVAELWVNSLKPQAVGEFLSQSGVPPWPGRCTQEWGE